MGTNYYARTNCCEYCQRPEQEIHIGKSSMGWTFTFHATETIRSYQDWLKFFEEKNCMIFDEYGRYVSHKEFTDMVEAKKDADANHAKYVKDNHPYDKSYLDSEGHSMSPHEFS